MVSLRYRPTKTPPFCCTQMFKYLQVVKCNIHIVVLNYEIFEKSKHSLNPYLPPAATPLLLPG